MDSVFQELDYSDITAKNIQNNNKNDKNIFGINVKKGNFKLIIFVSFIILLLLLLILIIVISVKNSKYNEIENKIKENKEQIILKKKILEEKRQIFNKKEKNFLKKI